MYGWLCRPCKEFGFTLNTTESYWSILSKAVTSSNGGLLPLPNSQPVPNTIPWKKKRGIPFRGGYGSNEEVKEEID